MRGLLLLFTMLSTLSCGNSKRIPDDIIPKEKMENIFWDMIMADRLAAQYILKDSAIKDVKKESFMVYDKVFQTHRISQEEFIKSYKYYISRPDISRVIFDSLSNRGSRKRQESYKKME